MLCRQGKEDAPGLWREHGLTITSLYQVRHALSLAAAPFTALLLSLSLSYLLTMIILLGNSFVSWLVYGRTSWRAGPQSLVC